MLYKQKIPNKSKSLTPKHFVSSDFLRQFCIGVNITEVYLASILQQITSQDFSDIDSPKQIHHTEHTTN